MKIKIISIFLFVVMFPVWNISAVAPSPDVTIKWKEQGIYKKQMDKLIQAKLKGLCEPSENKFTNNQKALATQEFPDTVNILVLCVDFSDHKFLGDTYGQEVIGKAKLFDTLLFSDPDNPDHLNTNPTGSMTEYFLENSYGKYYVKGKVYGWLEAPKPYTYYVGDDNGLSKSRELAREAVQIADTLWDSNPLFDIDFSDYDYNGDNVIDGLIIIHAGPGRETVVDTTIPALWSHKYNLDVTQTFNNTVISEYIMAPEEIIDSKGTRLSPIGVFCHEFGHILGLPDLYDTDPDPEEKEAGLGRWSLMAAGNYNSFSEKPAHLDAWSKIKTGFVTPIVITENISQAEIPYVEESAVIYKLQNSSASFSEYWLVENRRKTMFDVGIPASGLCIYHIDELAGDNNDPNRFHVALEQADGLNQLGLPLVSGGGGNHGDAGDVWPGSSDNFDFYEYSQPHSRTNLGGFTEIAVWDISSPGEIMYADLDVSYSRPRVELDRVNPYVVESKYNNRINNIIEPGDTVSIFIRAINKMRTTFNATAVLSTTIYGAQMINDNALITEILDDSQYYSNTDPIIFIMPDSLQPAIDSIYISITSDTLAENNSVQYHEQFVFAVQIGQTGILLVDDDGGADYEQVYQQSLSNLNQPYDLWDTESSGSPTPENLSNYSIVVWFTGDSTSVGLDSSDMLSIQTYLDAGGSLLLSSYTAADSMNNYDRFFMSNYFRCTSVGIDFKDPIFVGSTKGSDWEGLNMFVQAQKYKPIDLLTPLSPGQEALLLRKGPADSTVPVIGVAFAGSFKTFFTTLPLEYIDNDRDPASYQPVDSLIKRVLDFFEIGFVTDVEDSYTENSVPKSFELRQNYPNPFNPTTSISFTVANESGNKTKTSLSIYNMLGQKVTTLVNKYLKAGNYKVEWDGTNQNGLKISSGVYLYQLIHDSQSDSKKMILLK